MQEGKNEKKSKMFVQTWTERFSALADRASVTPKVVYFNYFTRFNSQAFALKTFLLAFLFTSFAGVWRTSTENPWGISVLLPTNDTFFATRSLATDFFLFDGIFFIIYLLFFFLLLIKVGRTSCERFFFSNFMALFGRTSSCRTSHSSRFITKSAENFVRYVLSWWGERRRSKSRIFRSPKFTKSPPLFNTDGS